MRLMTTCVRGAGLARVCAACMVAGGAAMVSAIVDAGDAGSSTAGAAVATSATAAQPASATPSAAIGEPCSRARFLSSSC
jgi:hypothetical protein